MLEETYDEVDANLSDDANASHVTNDNADSNDQGNVNASGNSTGEFQFSKASHHFPLPTFSLSHSVNRG